jgi:hypothetical protein
MDQLAPIWEIVLGTVPLVVTLFIHGAGMYVVQSRFKWHLLRAGVTRLRNELFFGAMILIMLTTHLVEIVVWAATLLTLEAVPSLREAFYYVAGTYTTLGYGEGTLPKAWRLLGPMIAISGLFAFGWTTGVLVNLVNQTYKQRIAIVEDPPGGA